MAIYTPLANSLIENGLNSIEEFSDMIIIQVEFEINQLSYQMEFTI